MAVVRAVRCLFGGNCWIDVPLAEGATLHQFVGQMRANGYHQDECRYFRSEAVIAIVLVEVELDPTQPVKNPFAGRTDVN
jgi:hypothetical protein